MKNCQNELPLFDQNGEIKFTKEYDFPALMVEDTPTSFKERHFLSIVPSKSVSNNSGIVEKLCKDNQKNNQSQTQSVLKLSKKVKNSANFVAQDSQNILKLSNKNRLLSQDKPIRVKNSAKTSCSSSKNGAKKVGDDAQKYQISSKNETLFTPKTVLNGSKNFPCAVNNSATARLNGCKRSKNGCENGTENVQIDSKLGQTLSQDCKVRVSDAIQKIRKKYRKMGEQDKFVMSNATRRAILKEFDTLRWSELILTVFPYLEAISLSIEKNIDQIAYGSATRTNYYGGTVECFERVDHLLSQKMAVNNLYVLTKGLIDTLSVEDCEIVACTINRRKKIGDMVASGRYRMIYLKRDRILRHISCLLMQMGFTPEKLYKEFGDLNVVLYYC